MSTDKRKRILEAARECFANYGFKKTTLEDIGSAIGLNKASIYYYFKNKEEIYTSVIMYELEQFIEQLKVQIEELQTCEDRIITYFVEKMSFWSKHSTVISQITETNSDQLKTIMAFGVDLYNQIEEGEKRFLIKILNQCLANGHIVYSDVQKTCDLLFSIADGIKDRHIGFNKLRVMSQDEHNQMMKDITLGLKIFIEGLKARRDDI